MTMTPAPAIGSASLARALVSGNTHDAHKAAEEFEAVFVNQLLESMFAGESTDGPFSGGASEGIYRSFMNESVSKAIAARGGIGIASSVYQQILKLQEENNHAPADSSPSARG